MKFYIHFIPFQYILLRLLVRATELNNTTLENYLIKKGTLLSTKQELHQHPDSSEFNLKLLDYHESIELWKFAYSFTLFNESYLMLNRDFYKTFNGKYIIAKPILEAVDDRKRITMAKVIENGNLGLMFVVLNDKYVRIIKFENDISHYQTVQTIEHRHISDVTFFKNHEDVYLIVSNNNGNNLAPLSLYKWKDSQFDEQETLLMAGVKQIKVFNDEGKQVLLILRNIEKEHYCNVYEFEDQTLNKRQIIKVDKPGFILPYKIGNDQYILFLNNHNGSIYRWSGFDLVKWSTQEISSNFNKTIVMYTHSTPLIFGISTVEVNIYSPTPEKINLVRTVISQHEFTRILDVEYVRLNSTDILFIIGNNKDFGIVESFTVQISNGTTEKVPLPKDPIYTCLNELNDILTIIPTENSTMDKSRSMRSLTSGLGGKITEVELDDKLAEIEEKYSSVAPIIEGFVKQGNAVVVNGNLIVNGTLKGDELSTQILNVKTVNDKKWTPNQWLSYTKNQTIPGFIQAKDLNIKKLDVTPEVTIFDDLLLNNSKSQIRGSVTINNFNTNKMFVNNINNIKMKDVFMRDRDSFVTGTKTFTHITADSVQTKNIMNANSKDVLLSLDRIFTNQLKKPKFSSRMFIENLIVEDIDGVNWNTFKDSVFRYGTTETITGNIRMNSFSSENLNLITLNGHNVEKFMTTSTDQNISASIKFSNIFASNITANTVNGISLTEVATINNSSIKGPVTIEDIHILGNLIFNISMEDSLKRDQHIIGTNESDFLQIYTDRVKIIGNLRVRNLKTQPFTTIVVEKENELEEFDPNLPEKYWMKNENQVIPVHVEMQEGLTTPHLQTKLLNGFGMLNFLLNNTNKTLPASFAFENVTFLGNVFLNDDKIHTPDLKKINTESVKTNGTFVISGKKIFKDSLKIKDLRTDDLNNIKPNELYHLNSEANFSGVKIFEKLVINGNFTSNNHSCKEINGVNLKQLQENAIYIDRPQDFKSLSFMNITIGNALIGTLNDMTIDEYMVETNDMFDGDVIDSLIINGKLTIGNLMNLSKINEKDPEVLYINKMELDEQGILHGHVRFTQNVTIDNLSASFINNIHFPTLVSRLLYKSGNQTIPAVFGFQNIVAENLVTSYINDINIEDLVNIETFETQRIFAKNGVEFSSTIIDKLSGDNVKPCNIEEALSAMRSPPTQKWSNMKIIGNVTIMDQENALYEIFENVVLTNEKNYIKAPVRFSNISVENILTHKHINNIDLGKIFSDALLKQSDETQIITGRNIFESLAIYKGVVLNNSDIPVINDFEIGKISQQIIPKDEVHSIPIRGRKTFYAGLQTDSIKSKVVSDVIPENFVTLNDSRIIPSATFEFIEIMEDLSINRINDQDFKHFLEERILISGPPVQEVSSICSFNDIHIEGNLTTPSINNIEISDVVFDISNQEITSRKTFSADIYVTGNVEIEMLNEYKISEIYQKTMLRNQESYTKNMEIIKPSLVNGIIYTESINGYPLETFRNILNSETANHLQEETIGIIDAIKRSAFKNWEIIRRLPSEVMYFEKSTGLQISFPETINAHTFNLADYVMIQIEGEQEGNWCGMPTHCKCPVHYTVQISPENSISYFVSKDFQRIYNYADDFMAAHLITNTVTTDMICRTNTSHSEYSTLAWNTVKSGNITGDIYAYPIDFIGYISAVEYFSLKNFTYVIIGTYYNSTANSYDLDTIVLKFSKDRTSVSEIQRIKTVGVWSLKVFYTVQGVNLIIGMLGDGHPNTNFEKTLFMRFDETAENFFLLREVPAYGCSSSVGIVVRSESFIALSHRKHPLLIFKYDKHQDNYVYYQHLWEPSLVKGISLFYNEDYDMNDPYLCIVSEHGVYSIYTYEHVGGWQRQFRGEIEGLRNLIPFEFKEDLYLFAPSKNASSVLSVAKFGTK